MKYPSAFAVCRLTELYLTAIVVEIDNNNGANMQRTDLNMSIHAYMTSSLPTLSNVPSADTRAFLISILKRGILKLLNLMYPLSWDSKPYLVPISPTSTPKNIEKYN